MTPAPARWFRRLIGRDKCDQRARLARIRRNAYVVKAEMTRPKGRK